MRTFSEFVGSLDPEFLEGFEKDEKPSFGKKDKKEDKKDGKKLPPWMNKGKKDDEGCCDDSDKKDKKDGKKDDKKSSKSEKKNPFLKKGKEKDED